MLNVLSTQLYLFAIAKFLFELESGADLKLK